MKEPMNKPNANKDIWPHENRKPATLRLPLNTNSKPIPQVDGKFAAGTVIVINNEPELIVDRIHAPCLGYVEGMIEITGNSMEPTYTNGCRIAIARLNDYRLLNWGQFYYILDKNWQGIVRRVYESENKDSIKLVSDYADQIISPPFYRYWNEIAAIFKIIACINKQ